MNAQDIKDFCKERNITYKELAQLLGMTEGGLQNAIKKDIISSQTERAIELLKEIENLKAQLQEWENLKSSLKKALL